MAATWVIQGCHNAIQPILSADYWLFSHIFMAIEQNIPILSLDILPAGYKIWKTARSIIYGIVEPLKWPGRTSLRQILAFEH